MKNTEENINKILDSGNIESLEVIKNGFHFIRTLVTNYAKKKDLISINYKTDLNSGVRLDPVYHFTNDGLMDKTIYYYNDKPVLQVSEIYEYNKNDLNNSNMFLSKKGIHSRKKTWRYFFENGNLDLSNIEGTFKTKEKYYKTDIEGLVVGSKRRHNISIILSQRAGTLLVIMGIFPGAKEVKDAMRSISAKYSANFQEYEKYGTELIIDDIIKDTDFKWLDVYIPTNTDMSNMVAAGQMSISQKAMLEGALKFYNLTNIQGMNIRNYFCEKLKGNIK